MQPILFIDRDGTIIEEPEDEQIDAIEKLNFLPSVLYYLRKIQEETNFSLVMVTNQDGLGTESHPEKNFWPIQDLIMRILDTEQIMFDAVHIDEHFAADNHPNRKPGIGMLSSYLDGSHDIASSFVIGDRLSDVELAKNLGCRGILLSDQKSSDAALTTESWKEIYEFLLP